METGHVLEVTVTALLSTLLWLLPKVFAWIDSKTKTENTRRILATIEEVATATVRAANQTIVDEFRRSNATSGRPLSAVQAASVKTHVVRNVLDVLGEKTLLEAKKAGIASAQRLIEAKVEEAVVRVKKSDRG